MIGPRKQGTIVPYISPSNLCFHLKSGQQGWIQTCTQSARTPPSCEATAGDIAQEGPQSHLSLSKVFRFAYFMIKNPIKTCCDCEGWTLLEKICQFKICMKIQFDLVLLKRLRYNPISLSWWIRRPLCLAWGGGAREARSIDSVFQWQHRIIGQPVHIFGGQPVHVYGVPATSFTFRLRHAFYSGFEGALSAACVGGANAALFGFPELGFRWCLAFSHPLPMGFLFASVADELHSGCAMFRLCHA